MGIFDFFKRLASPPGRPKPPNFDALVKRAHAEIHRNGRRYWSMKTGDSETFKNELLPLSVKQKVAFVDAAARHISAFYKVTRSYSSNERKWQMTSIWNALMNSLLKTPLELDDEDIDQLVHTFVNHKYQAQATHVLYWPTNLLLSQVEKQLKERSVTGQLQHVLEKMRIAVEEPANPQHEKEQVKILARIDAILFKASGNTDEVMPSWFPGEDDFAAFANESIKRVRDQQQLYWFQLMAIAKKASGSKPSKKMLDESKAVFKELGTEKFKKQVNDWFEFIVTSKDKITTKSYTFNNEQFDVEVHFFLANSNIDIIRAFVWMCVHFHDKTTLFNVANLAERVYRKIPGKGAGAPVIGNACLYVLAHSKGLDGVGHLSRLKLRIKQTSTQALVDKYLMQAAADQGVTVHEIEDLAVDDHGLTAGKREYTFGDYKAILEITGIGKTNLQWCKPDGSLQKSVPAFVKEQHTARLKKVKDTIKQIEATLTGQRDRVDRMLKANRQLSWQQFSESYIGHGLMSFIAQRLIWLFSTDGKTESGYYRQQQWVNNKGEKITEPGEQTKVSLWHPVLSNVNEIRLWREFMMEHTIVQPLKQAYREVYLLTEAEIHTRTYSNRMAAHILKQHQFNSLAKTRGWKYSLLGAFDNGRDNDMAHTNLTDYNLRAEYWINGVNAEDALSDTGLWLYIATDQVRFVNTTTNQVVQLVDVPAIVLSEVMRDVDLFVGVASVGNDAAWRDSGGIPAYRDYWQSYSFGELTEVAKTRKAILERLIPRLKIAKVTTIKDKFLVVKGKLRTYKIHLGSTNILMEPNDQYLCIVPDRVSHDRTGNIFLPFEGDNGLSIIISKALLLAEDDAITDPTITQQIKK
jgi:hypothetical protein